MIVEESDTWWGTKMGSSRVPSRVMPVTADDEKVMYVESQRRVGMAYRVRSTTTWTTEAWSVSDFACMLGVCTDHDYDCGQKTS